jgi:N-methylhydantoinase A
MLAPIQHEALNSFEIATAAVNLDQLQTAFTPLLDKCTTKMKNDGIDPADTTVEHLAEMRYIGQSHQLEITLGDSLVEETLPNAVQLFHDTHQATYNHSDPDAETEFVILRLVQRKSPPESSLLEANTNPPDSVPEPTERQICISAETGYEPIPVFQRKTLPAGFEILGPAIVEQADTTTLIYRDHLARVDEFGNIIIDVPETKV